ncbi:glycosyltransferase family 2 protein [Kordiimonas gwangyangensis]|uniref:glycosyltransferase family 2 protein n=1 Tax=Kordiimonas gwangyangensis TaxID=288022 RepID=UPI00035CCFB1|nr:glycosyltransferase family 2 protein [Kordiimonas gwangyangensis]
MKKPFSIVSITMVKNERDVIEPFVRHNLRFVDYMIVVDNNSTDDTRDILVNLARETGRVGVFDRKQSSFTQGEFLTRVMQAVQSVCFADFFVFLDGDEFIGAASPEAFKAEIDKIPQFGFGLVPWRTYVLPEGQDMAAMTANPPMSMKWCRVREGEQHYKVILRTGGKILLDHQISNGNHTVLHAKGGKIPSVKLTEAPLLHFPVRSVEQLTVKCVNGWMAMLAKQASGIKLGRNECHQWRENFERAMAGTIGEELSPASYFYSRPAGTVDWATDVQQLDHGIECERRYSDGRYGEVLRLVGKAWEASYQGTPAVLPGKFRSDFLNIVSGKPVDPKVVAKVDKALAARTYLDVPLLRWVYDYVQPTLALEVGCGFGANLATLHQFGVKGLAGIENRPAEETFLRGNSIFNRPLDEFHGTSSPVDLVLCLGALAGLEQKEVLRGATAVSKSAKGHILFSSHAADGSDPEPKVSLAQWLSVWSQLGWVPDMAATLAARAVATVPAFRRNLLLLKRAGEGEVVDTQFLQWTNRLPCSVENTRRRLFEEPFGIEAAAFAGTFRPADKK